jgi:hypothetical protein
MSDGLSVGCVGEPSIFYLFLKVIVPAASFRLRASP